MIDFEKWKLAVRKLELVQVDQMLPKVGDPAIVLAMLETGKFSVMPPIHLLGFTSWRATSVCGFYYGDTAAEAIVNACAALPEARS